MIQLRLLIKRGCFIATGCLAFCAVTLYASPDFSPQFRWKQDNTTVADNHEQANTQNDSTSNQAPPQDSQPENKTSDIDSDVDTEKIIEALENSIQIEDIIEPPASYRYSSFNKRDPFAYPDREEMFDDEFIISKLQRYDVSSLKLVGVWRLSTGVSKALVLTPTGEGVVATIDDPIGQNNGEVMEIGRNKIIIREYIMTPDGTRQFNDIDMFIEDYFASTGGASGEGLQVLSDYESDTSLGEDLDKLQQDVVSPADKEKKTPVDAPNTPANAPANAPNMPASTNAPTQPQGSP